MTIFRITALAAILTLFCFMGFSYAAPSCCDPNGSAGVPNNSLLAQPALGQYATAKPAPYGNVNPGLRKAPVAPRTARAGTSQVPACCDPTGRGAQTYSPPPPSCCPGGKSAYTGAGAYVGRAQAPVGGCGGGCGGCGKVSSIFPGYETARPIGQFTGAPPRGAKAIPAVNQVYPVQRAPAYESRGFGLSGYFGQGTTVSNTLW